MFTDGWSKEGAQAFTHLGDGNVYDNPEFQIVFKTTSDNQYWKIIPKTNYEGDFWAEGEKGVVGVVTDGDVAAEGNLTTNQPKAGKIEKAGYHRMTINMMTIATRSRISTLPSISMRSATRAAGQHPTRSGAATSTASTRATTTSMASSSSSPMPTTGIKTGDRIPMARPDNWCRMAKKTSRLVLASTRSTSISRP